MAPLGCSPRVMKQENPMLASRTFFLSLPILLSLMDGRLAAAQKPYEELVPEGSTLFFTLRNVSDVTKWFEASPLAEAWKSPEMTAFVKQVTSTIESKITQANKDWGNAFGDLKEICQGEVALAIGDPSSISFTGEVKEFPVAVLMDV